MNNQHKYPGINKLIKQRIKQAKGAWLTEKCREIEEFEQKYDYFNSHKTIKELTGLNKTRIPNRLRDASGKLIDDIEDKLKLWTEYIEDIFKDEGRGTQIEEEYLQETGLKIIKEEIEYGAKNGKASGPYEIPVELFKLMNEKAIDTLISTFVTIRKNANDRECSECRTISLMSHALELFLRILHNRIYRKLEDK